MCVCMYHDIIVLDISKHIQLYRAVLMLLSSLATNVHTQSLLVLHAYQVQEGEELGRAEEGGKTLQVLIRRLSKIANAYSKTVRYISTVGALMHRYFIYSKKASGDVEAVKEPPGNGPSNSSDGNTKSEMSGTCGHTPL